MNNNRNIVLLGSGESGVGAAILAQKQGYGVFVSDFGTIKEVYKLELNKRNIEFEEGQHSEEKILAADIIIKSPGIPDKAPIIKKIKEKQIEIISEIEFAYRFTKAKIIAITGSNGKTTTTSLVYHILKNAGLNVGLGGNIGDSFAKQVAEEDKEYFVLEISSFQLDNCTTFKPHIAILTNITEDHLDRYDYKFENYISSKFSIAKNQTEDDFFIYCLDDEVSKKYLNQFDIKAKLIPFSYYQKLEEGGYIEDKNLIININKNKFTMPTNELALQGIHNTYNSLAAGIGAKLFNVRNEKIRDSFQDFKSLEHRLEFVATVKGVDFINDSKATNVNSTWYALESMIKPTVLILGGVDKGNDYTLIKDLVKEKVKAIICLGKDNEALHQAFANEVGYIVDTQSMEQAVNMAYNIAEKEEVVLLSPCCASFDLFENYEDRGRQFKRNVLNL
ncbi:MAG TPA: UDP-N-acetylmuramoyl-L-alanine--D-glutamate ligase [Chitinophagales bacterium]|nr:UDP-N-acetylmuramoyl-L-alanine--D-glutamate ligase [Chitinophagales bacterium]MCB9074338.1 UDP-N-acetylmuramoyl-L-alanine--D-glutamate ligase [Chitinophagales bacterium]HMY41675.1 UDP-N-acetylmuramoyl-L-alanine--D-glutamate ligase [Chitinophagales bacterium]HNB37939.1 UDP-N-acetylmuramoyl-L-alanine--D-glutamate ligase [Chitinophagales bacterium]HNC63174.1 UDP-N-acetylmuramoyl-L-alanine--D-glutamate ligase [Chitinophagales bacterium]